MPLSSIVKEPLRSIRSPPAWGRDLRFDVRGARPQWSWPGSNRRPPACKTGALPTELQPRREKPLAGRRMVGLSGFEPLTSRLSGGRSNQLSYRPTPNDPELVREGSLTSEHKKKRSDQDVSLFCDPLKGGDPAARSRTATLLRLHPNHRPYLRHLPPCG